MKRHLLFIIVKRSCDTRWKSKLESVKALRYQITEVRDALAEVVETTEDSKAKSEAASLIHEISSYEFLLAIAIWYDVLFVINSASKNLHAEKMHLGVAFKLLHGLVTFFIKFRDEGYVGATITAREMCESLGIEPKFREVRTRKRKNSLITREKMKQ